ncbi:type IV secretory pathway TrbL component [Angulomicrobium tetraedrale]|uniref:Type IV secretory pathway TrbL component n=1 Tax=Ancylobacter tetraedralis TaxID=217068 RepID=A0A839Z8I7_9HYPH|nr:DUF5330 domain-containing protein [Ancylobacter tetraedralis]MBB3769777.1 type IV secretory pathway TrbL component [Ancylobacter tetraedralis]
MFFLLRVAFWLTIVLLLLPSIPGGPLHDAAAPKDPPVGAMEALSAATSAMADASGFCARQPQACVIGAGVIQMISERAEAGARFAISYIAEQIGEEKRRAAARATGTPTGDTLTTRDLSPEWQGPTVPGAAPNETSASAPAGGPGPASPAPAVPLPPKRPA